MWDHGYSSYNIGGIKCKGCKHEIKVSPCDIFPTQQFITIWNNDKKEFMKKKTKLKNEIKKMEKILERAKKILEKKKTRKK